MREYCQKQEKRGERRQSPRFIENALIASVRAIGQVQEDKDERKRTKVTWIVRRDESEMKGRRPEAQSI